jgi:hypothetical protein
LNKILCMDDRRRHRRIITLKNFGWFTLAIVVALGAINVFSEWRAPRSNDYGRLTQREIRRVSPAISPRVREAPVVGGANAPVRPGDDAVLLDTTQPQQPPLAAPAGQVRAPAPPATVSASDRVAIVGDENGVAIVTPKHKLRGGFPPQ